MVQAIAIEQLQANSGELFDTTLRRYNDTVTWLSEVLPGSMRTPFEYYFQDNELYAEDGSGLRHIFDDAIEDAESLPDFELRRRKIEKSEYLEMIDMMKGNLPNTMIVISDFPPELMNASSDYGGYNVERKQTMLRVLTRTDNNRLMMYSQSLDQSDRRALERIYKYCGYSPQTGELLGQRMHLQLADDRQDWIIDELMGVYDRALTDYYGGEWYSGIRGGVRHNTYDFVRQQADLINAYIATSTRFAGGDKEYALASAIKQRFNGETAMPVVSYSFASPVANMMAMMEMEMASERAVSRGEVYSGCGMSIEATIVNQFALAGYGNKSLPEETDKYGSLQFKCPSRSCGYINKRPKNRLLSRCKGCHKEIPKC